MTPAPKVLLCCPVSDASLLAGLVETWLKESVSLVAVVGEGAEQVEEEIDWLVVGDASDNARFLMTSAHEGETFDEVLEFVTDWRAQEGGEVRVVRI